MAEAEETEGQAELEFLEKVRKQYHTCVEAEESNRARAREALAFRDLEQWDERTRNERLNDPEGARPCLVVDKLNQHINQVVNDERLNRPQIKVRPVEGGDIEVAKIFDGIIRHIQDRSHADVAYDTAFEAAVDGGFGYWRILTEYAAPMSFDQDIKIGRIRNRFAVYLDPQRQEPDGSDSEYGFILYKCTKDEFKREFGEKAEAALESFQSDGREFTEWYGEDWVYYAEYFWRDLKKETICLLTNGQVVKKSDYTPEQLAMSGLAIMAGQDGRPMERETMMRQVRWRKLTATKVLEEGEWAGEWIPIVEVVGNELDIEGRVMRSGMIRGAMDAQRVDNYATSAFVENVALAPRASWTAAQGQLEGNEELWRTSNRRNISVLPYKPITIDGIIVPAPQRAQPPGISQGWLSVLEQAEHNVQAAMGRYNATLGAPSNETSGRAINARAREGDIGSFHFSDNLSRSLRHTGRIMVDIIPKYYDRRRVARIIGEDGTPGTAIIDPALADESGQPIPYAERPNDKGEIDKIYNLSVGRYDVTVVTGPSFTTRRLESADAMMEISRGNPDFLMQFGDIVFKSQDWPGAEQIAARFKKMLPPQLQEDETKDREGKIARQEAQIQEAVKALGQKEAQVNAAQQQIEQVATEAQEREQQAKEAENQAKDALRKVQAEVDKLNALQTALENERQLFELQKQLAEKEAQIAMTTAQAEKDVLESEVKVLTANMDKKLAEINSATQEVERENRSQEETARLIQVLMEKIEKVEEMAGAERELIVDANGEPVGSRPKLRAVG